MFTRLWNIRHRKLIEETKRIIRIQEFLNECGLGKINFTVEDLKEVSRMLSKRKNIL
ncbi:MAG: hypothetical protein WCY09_01565 [Candidatus Omnitrophota bacterium]